MAKYRIARKWTRARLAKKVGLTPYWMGHIERTGRCPAATCDRIAKALGTTVEELRARVPLGLEEVVCRKHGPAFVKLDRMLHEGGAMSAFVAVAIDAIIAAIKSGFSAEQSIREHIEAGLINHVSGF